MLYYLLGVLSTFFIILQVLKLVTSRNVEDIIIGKIYDKETYRFHLYFGSLFWFLYIPVVICMAIFEILINISADILRFFVKKR